MKLTEKVWSTCGACGRHDKMLQDETYGCDECRKKIDLNKKGIEYLDVAVFYHTKETEHRHYCSWKCCLKGIRKIKTDYFLSLPFLTFDSKAKGVRPKDFFALLKP